MGKRLPSTAKIEAYARLASERIKPSKLPEPQSKTLEIDRTQQRSSSTPKPPARSMENDGRRNARVPLGDVVSECVRRWFQDTLKEARNGDQSMQVLVGQMYQSGYGVAKNEQKVRSFFMGLWLIWELWSLIRERWELYVMLQE